MIINNSHSHSTRSHLSRSGGVVAEVERLSGNWAVDLTIACRLSSVQCTRRRPPSHGRRRDATQTSINTLPPHFWVYLHILCGRPGRADRLYPSGPLPSAGPDEVFTVQHSTVVQHENCVSSSHVIPKFSPCPRLLTVLKVSHLGRRCDPPY